MRPKFSKRLASLLVAFLGASALLTKLALASSSFATAPDYAWAAPQQPALKQVGTDAGSGATTTFYSNTDCTPTTYHLAYEPFTSDRSGCVVQTAFGWLDVDHSVLTDYGMGALPLKMVNGQSPIPVPKSDTVGSIALAGGNQYLHFYNSFADRLQVQLDIALQPYVQMPDMPSLTVKDNQGNPLPVNPQTIAYSSNGAWMVVESPMHAFVRINMASLEVVPFAPSATGEVYDLAQHNSQVAITDDGRYIALQSNEFGSFKVYDLKNCVVEGTDLQPLNCPSYDYATFLQKQIPGLKTIRQVRFTDDGLLSFVATTADGTFDYEMAPSGQITNELDYLALGDSFTSGEGAGSYSSETDTENNHCHLSTFSYPLLLSSDIFTKAGSHSVACSGAVIRDVGSTSDSYRGQVVNGPRLDAMDNASPSLSNVLAAFTPGYIPQHMFAQHYQPKVITVSIGGNDSGFGNILAACVSPHFTYHPDTNTCYDTYEDRLELVQHIDSLRPTLAALYKQLHTESPTSRIYAIGYPQIVVNGNECGLNVHLNPSEIEFAQEIITHLDSVVQQAARDSSVNYVDVSNALAGHRLCETNGSSVAMNGVTAGKSSGISKTIAGKTVTIDFLGSGSFHPNQLGQELLEQAILKATKNFTLTLPAEAVSDDTTAILNQPKTGRVTRKVIPATISNRVVKRGSSLPIHVSGEEANAKPNSTFVVTLQGATTGLGVVNSDDQGAIDGTVTIPPEAPTGGQTIEIIGENDGGEPIEVTTPIYIPVTDGDTDGDGLPDDTDSCPTVANSGTDADQDGIDDVCDPLITTPPVVNNPPSTPITIVQTPNSPPESQSPVSTGEIWTTTQSDTASRDVINDSLISISGNTPATTIKPLTAVLAASTQVLPSALKPGATLAGHLKPIDNLKFIPLWVLTDIGLCIVLITLTARLAKPRSE